MIQLRRLTSGAQEKQKYEWWSERYENHSIFSKFWKCVKHLENEEICQLNLRAGWNEGKPVPGQIATGRKHRRKGFLWLEFLLSMGKSPSHKPAGILPSSDPLVSDLAGTWLHNKDLVLTESMNAMLHPQSHPKQDWGMQSMRVN